MVRRAGTDGRIGGSPRRVRPGDRTDFAGFRAAFVDLGSDPGFIETHSLYEILSTLQALKARRGPQQTQMTEQDYDEMVERIRARNLPDVRL